MQSGFEFKIPLSAFEKIVGSINDFSTIRFARIFMTGFKQPTHLRFATLELVRGEWRNYDFNLNSRGDTPAEGELDVSVVNIEENADREPVNYVLPPGVTRIVDPGQSQITQLNEQSLSLKVTDLRAGDARGIYRNTQQDFRNYKRLQMWTHAESLIDDHTNLRSGELSVFIRLGTDVKSNFYEYEMPLQLTPHGRYNNWTESDRATVWPNFMDIKLQNLVDLKQERNRAKAQEGSEVGFATLYTGRDPDNERCRIAVMGNPSLSDVRVMLVGVRNNTNNTKDGIIWINELKVTDFNEEGGWAAKANVNLGLSDVASVNFATHMETAGFGSVDQSLNSRRLDNYEQYNVAMQVDAGRFLPEKVKLRAPIYYSYSKEKTTPNTIRSTRMYSSRMPSTMPPTSMTATQSALSPRSTTRWRVSRSAASNSTSQARSRCRGTPLISPSTSLSTNRASVTPPPSTRTPTTTAARSPTSTRP